MESMGYGCFEKGPSYFPAVAPERTAFGVAGGIFMLIGALAEACLGVDAERRSLESIALPLQSE